MSALGNWTDADQERFAKLLWAKAEERLKCMSRDDILSMIVHGESGLIESPVAELTANLEKKERRNSTTAEVRRGVDTVDEVFAFKFADFLHWNYEQKNPACPHVLEACWSHMESNPEIREDLLFASMISMHDDAFPKKEGETVA